MMLRKEFEPLFGPSVAAPSDPARPVAARLHDRTGAMF
jgi:hypothetical protein